MFWSVKLSTESVTFTTRGGSMRTRSNTRGKGTNIQRPKWQMKQHFLMRIIARHAWPRDKRWSQPASRNLFAKYCASMRCGAVETRKNVCKIWVGQKMGRLELAGEWRREQAGAGRPDGLGCRVYNPQTWEWEGHFGERKLATCTVNKIPCKVSIRYWPWSV